MFPAEQKNFIKLFVRFKRRYAAMQHVINGLAYVQITEAGVGDNLGNKFRTLLQLVLASLNFIFKLVIVKTVNCLFVDLHEINFGF